MNTHELQQLPPQEFFEAIGEVYKCIEGLESSINNMTHDINFGTFYWLPKIADQARHHIDIKQRAKIRLQHWAKKQMHNQNVNVMNPEYNKERDSIVNVFFELEDYTAEDVIKTVNDWNNCKEIQNQSYSFKPGRVGCFTLELRGTHQIYHRSHDDYNAGIDNLIFELSKIDLYEPDLY